MQGVIEEYSVLAGALEEHLVTDADDGDEGYTDALVRCVERVADYVRRSAQVLEIVLAERREGREDIHEILALVSRSDVDDHGEADA